MSRVTNKTRAVVLPTTEALVTLLGQVSTYAERPRTVSVIETHISWVFLTDNFAYKLKKPVKYDFLDFSTPELRRQACEAEVRLNRRLAPSTYLGVVPITATSSGRLKLDGEGAPVDWLVRMRRLPAQRSLDKLIATHSLTDSQTLQVAETLDGFYRREPPISLRTERYREQIERHVQGNRAELLEPSHGFETHLVQRIHSAQLRALRIHPDVFDDRVRDGRLVEGHGDLRPEHIYLNPSPTIIDCVEFNSEFRHLDVLDELSFLAVECAHLGAKEVGGRILDYYCRTSGDRPPAVLLAFYMSYRASVRAKVHALRGAQLAAADRDASRRIAQEYLVLAGQYAAEIGPPLLLIVRGLTGVGKSTLAREVADSLGMELIQTDVVRQDLFPPCEREAGYDEGKYQLANRMKVYEEVFKRAGALLAKGLSVVMDGTFLTTKLRAQASLLARQYEAEPTLIECVCPDDVAAQRIAMRLAATTPVSESRPEFVRLQREQEEPDPPGLSACRVDTNASLPAMLRQVFGHLRQP